MKTFGFDILLPGLSSWIFIFCAWYHFRRDLLLRCNLRDLRLQIMAENEVNESVREEGQEVIVDHAVDCAF